MYAISTEQEKEIEKKIDELSSKTGCALTICSVRSSTRYTHILWIVPAIIGVLTAFFISLASYKTIWPSYTEIFLVLAIQIGIMAGTFLALKLSPALCLVFIPKRKQLEQIQSKSKMTFMDRKIYETKNRMGILIYISILEKSVQVQTDSGVQMNTGESDWNPIISLLETQLQNENIYPHFINCIESVVEMLKKRGFRPGSNLSKHVIQSS